MNKLSTLLLTLLLAVSICSDAAAETADDNVGAELRKLLPAGVVIDKVRRDGQRVYVNGNAPSNAMVSQYLRSLEMSAPFERVELIQVQQVNGRIAYELMVNATESAAASESTPAPK